MKTINKKHRSNKSEGLDRVRYSNWKKAVKALAKGRKIENALQHVKLKNLFKQKFTPQEAVDETDPNVQSVRRKLKNF